MRIAICAATVVLWGNISFAGESALELLKTSVPASINAGAPGTPESAAFKPFTTQNCFDVAQSTPFGGHMLSRDNAFDLCGESSKPQAPLTCLDKAVSHTIAYQYRLSVEQGIQLCGGTAEAEAPLTCLDRTVSQLIGGYSLSLWYGLELCGGTSEPLAPLACLNRAVSPIDGIPVSLDEALKLCRIKPEVKIWRKK